MRSKGQQRDVIRVSAAAEMQDRDWGRGVHNMMNVFSLLPVGAPALARAVVVGSRAVSVPPPTDDGYTPTDQPRRKRQEKHRKAS